MWGNPAPAPQIEDRALVVPFRRRKVERVAGSDVQRQTRGNLPIVAHEEFGEIRARLNHVFLDVDGEGVDLPQQQRCQRVAAAGDGRTVAAGGGEGERSGGVRWIEHVQSFAPYVGSELDGVAAAHQRESIQEFRDGGGEFGVRRGGGADLLQARNCKEGQY